MENSHPFLTLKLKTINDTDTFDSNFKNVVLKFMFVFNVFESEFFEEPKWDDFNSNIKFEYKHVWQRINAMQDLCNEKNYPLELVQGFQEHFSKVYIENNTWTQRFMSLEKTEFNKNGYSVKQMGFMYDFLTKPLKINKNYAIKNALTLSYTFRNNLFHGQKDIKELLVYKDDFEKISDFLISFMKYLNKINADVF